MSTETDERADELDELDADGLELDVHDRSDHDRWDGVEVRGFTTPDLEILRSAQGGDGRTLTGIIVPFGRPQKIHEGLTEQFRRGAANHVLRTPGRMKLAREHLRFGGKLIGRATELRDDAAGLWGALRVAKTVDGDETLELVREGALDELSIGFRAVRDKRLPDGTIERVRIDPLETAVVLQGAYGRNARIAAVRSQEGAAAGAATPDPGVAPAAMSASYVDLVLATHRPRVVISRGMIR